MQIRKSHRIIAAVLSLALVFGMIPSTVFARSAGDDGSAEMNEAYAAQESLMPVGPSFNVDTLLEWTPESDPDAIYSRASIELADRVGGFVVNPLANPEAKLMLCSLANSDHDTASAQGTESFLSYSFNYWQYTDSFVYWSGSEEGIICCPTGEFTDAAHTNGVPVVATLGFPWGSGTGYVDQVKAFVQKAEDGSFPVADKLIEVMDYYGFDGYFFNQESYGCSAEEGALIDEMMRYMHEKRPDMIISWYDSMLPSGGVSYQNAVNSSNSQFMTESEDGTRAVDEFFMNYNWYASQISTTISTMQSIGRSQYDAFAGLNVQEDCMDSTFRDYLLVDDDGIAQISLALYCPNSTLGLSATGEDFHEVEQTFYTNAVGDPRDTSVDVTDSTVYDWAGMSRFFADKTVILDAPFVTDFNSGHGRYYFVDGVLSRESEWSYQSNQDVMPTWTWIIDSDGEKLDGAYDFTTAYNGGNSIKFYGNLTGGMANEIMLYSTQVTIESGMTLGLTYKGDQGLMKLVAYYGDASTSSYEECEKVTYTLTSSNGDWTTTTTDLSASAGKVLYAIGLKIESAEDVSDYQVNLGRLTLLEKDRATLSGPASVTLDGILYADAYTAEARIYWSSVTGASSYEIYKVNADGSKTLIMETPNTAFYIPTLTRDASETDVTLEVVAINRNGQRGTEGTQLVIDWAYTNDDSEKIENVEFENVCLGATITYVTNENSGEPASKAIDGTSANNSKWCASNISSGYMDIDIGREVTVRRWRVEHAEYGGEANNMNTIDFALEYKNSDGEWVQAKRIQNNSLAVTDVLLDEPITAQEWRLRIYNSDASPWGGIRIYEWQMFETAEFPQTEATPMQFASAVNGVGATDTFTLKNVPSGQTVTVYLKSGDEYTAIGSTESDGSTVVLENLDFGTADAGRVYYATTALSARESAKLSTAFEAEDAEKTPAATDVSFVKYSRDGSVSSSNGDGIYTTMTISNLEPGDVVYVYENGADEAYTKVSLPVGDGETSLSIDAVYVIRAGGTLALQVKRNGMLISDIYTVDTPVFDEPTGTIHLYAYGPSGESLTGVIYGVYDADGNEVATINTTSDSGGTADVPLGTYTLKCLDVPEGYGIVRESVTKLVTIEGWVYDVTVTIPDYVTPAVLSVTVDYANAIIGKSIQMVATVVGEGNYSDELTWEVSGNNAEDTTISDTGVLTISENETAKTLTVTATSVMDPTVFGSVELTVAEMVNLSKDSTIWVYRGTNLEGENGPEMAIDGDYTTKWVYEGTSYKLMAIDFGEWRDVYAVTLYNAGSAGEDASLNTETFHVYCIAEDNYYLDFWQRLTSVSERNLYLSSPYYYWDYVGTVEGNTDNVCTFTLEEPQSIRYLMVWIETPTSSEDDTTSRVYELEVESPDLSGSYRYELQAYYEAVRDSSIYSSNGYAALEQALADGLSAMDDCVSTIRLQEALDNAKAALDAVLNFEEEMQSIKEIAEEAQRVAEEALAAAKEAAQAAEEAAASAAVDKEAAEAARAKAEEAAKYAAEAQEAAEAATKAAQENNAAAAEEAVKAAQEAAAAAADAAKAAEAQKLAQEAQEAAEIAAKAAEEAAASTAVDKEAAEAARIKAEEAAAAAEEAKKAANEGAYEAASSAREAAYAASHAAEAQYAAQIAQEAAEEAAKIAEQAKADAVEAQKKAEEAAASAGEDSETAQEAAREAKEAQEAAEAAQQAAENAVAAAETAKNAADESNKQAAEAASQAAQYAKEVAETYAEIVKIKAEMVDYLNKAQLAADEAKKAALASAKYFALIKLAEIDTDSISADQAANVEAIIAAAIEDVTNAETAAQVEAILAEALEAIDEAAAWVCAAETFDDVSVDAWYHEAVDYMVNAGYMSGVETNLFAPKDSMTRGQFVYVLYRIAGEPDVSDMTNPFDDVAEGKYYTNAVIWAYDAGVVAGKSETTFAPNDTITRSEIVSILYRYDGSNAVEEDTLTGFADVDTVPTYAVEAMNWAVANGIVYGAQSGDDLILSPKTVTSRAEGASFLYRYLTK